LTFFYFLDFQDALLLCHKRQRWFSVTRIDYKSHDLLKIQGLSLVEILFVKKNTLPDLLSSLNAGISTNAIRGIEL
jgi:hypothetical protein